MGDVDLVEESRLFVRKSAMQVYDELFCYRRPVGVGSQDLRSCAFLSCAIRSPAGMRVELGDEASLFKKKVWSQCSRSFWSFKAKSGNLMCKQCSLELQHAAMTYRSPGVIIKTFLSPHTSSSLLKLVTAAAIVISWTTTSSPTHCTCYPP